MPMLMLANTLMCFNVDLGKQLLTFTLLLTVL